MTPDEIRATVTVCLLASFADGDKHERERAQIREVAQTLAGEQALNLPVLYQDVLMRRVDLRTVVAQLQSPESRQLAYEMAVCVCDADGQSSPAETAFLAQLRQALTVGGAMGVDLPSDPAPSPQVAAPASPALAGTVAGAAAGVAAHAAYTGFERDAHSLAAAPLDSQAPEAMVALPTGTAVPHPAAADALAQGATQQRPGALSAPEMDSKILKASILNGAIELLPENLSTLAIIPLQMRLVYQIGESYGYRLDSGHIKDLLATLGVGLTSQYLEQAGRKLLGGLLGKAGKGLLGGLGKQAVSSGMSFASTYALGHVANQYYAGGRTLSSDMLKNAYQHVMQDARQLQPRYQPQIQSTAQGLNVSKILEMVRGR